MASADIIAPVNTRTIRARLFAAIAHDNERARADRPLYVILVLLLVWAGAVVVWGLPALYLPAAVFSILFLGLLVAITRG
ncbi:hypothetical protein [Pararhodobacter sp.]|uniref:hypothetical protein n=1 Tax=Pararhodobacter sp. TaxID=2127056 RepID=UPI002AFEA125|nr:hypothetical protein [Pararhodobacter sp.]